VDFAQLSRFERINVVGTSGSGKSTFARELAGLLKLPYYEMDQLFWKPHWEGAFDDEFFQKVHAVTSGRRWVLDGNYTRTLPDKWKRVQLVIWLDLSIVRTVFRVSKRAIERSLSQQELWPGTGNRETLTKALLSKDSIIWWAITSFRKNKKRYRASMASPDYAHISFVRLKSAGSVASFLEGLRHVAENSDAPLPAAAPIALPD
jgi:adenylate kinase family enzyme